MIIMKRMVFSLWSRADTVSGPLLLYKSLDRAGPEKLPGAGCAVRLHLLVERDGGKSTRDWQIFRTSFPEVSPTSSWVPTFGALCAFGACYRSSKFNAERRQPGSSIH
jgi:hypothetical protein